MPNTDDLDVVGIKEIALRLHVRQQTAAAWKFRGLLPPAEGMVSGAPAWRWSTIATWAATRPARRSGMVTLRAIAAAGWDLRNAVEAERLAWVAIGQLDPPDVGAARRVDAAFAALTSLVIQSAVFPVESHGPREQPHG